MIVTLRRLLPYTTILCVIAAIYAGTVMYSRWSSNREAERAAKRKTVSQIRLIGDGLQILFLYATPPVIHRGEKTLMCYGTANARSVTLDPPVDQVWPAMSRCFDVSPRQKTTYKLTATDAAGKTVTQSVEIDVLH